MREGARHRGRFPAASAGIQKKDAMLLLGYKISIASAVGFIALGGVAAGIGVVMLVSDQRACP
jgi:Cu/Ag efflux pump CusA